jgi:hypothetical protein
MKFCHECKSKKDIFEYEYPDESTEPLCIECAAKAGFCIGCHNFCAGIESFDFSSIKGLCYDCVQELENELRGDEYSDMTRFEY